MLTRANKPVSFRPRYPTEKEALATHTVSFTDFIKEMLVSPQFENNQHSLKSVEVTHGLSCPITEALTATYPDMLPEVVMGFRVMGVAKILNTPGLTREEFRDDLMQKLAKVSGCWPALFDITKARSDIYYHNVRQALWNTFYNYNFEITGDYRAAYKFVALYKDEINHFFHYDLKRCVLSYGPTDTVTVPKEAMEYIKTEIMLHGKCDTFPVNVKEGPAIAFS